MLFEKGLQGPTGPSTEMQVHGLLLPCVQHIPEAVKVLWQVKQTTLPYTPLRMLTRLMLEQLVWAVHSVRLLSQVPPPTHTSSFSGGVCTRYRAVLVKPNACKSHGDGMYCTCTDNTQH
jgi:hypothetical protein